MVIKLSMYVGLHNVYLTMDVNFAFWREVKMTSACNFISLGKLLDKSVKKKKKKKKKQKKRKEENYRSLDWTKRYYGRGFLHFVYQNLSTTTMPISQHFPTKPSQSATRHSNMWYLFCKKDKRGSFLKTVLFSNLTRSSWYDLKLLYCVVGKD